jgi:hypothetical protein
VDELSVAVDGVDWLKRTLPPWRYRTLVTVRSAFVISTRRIEFSGGFYFWKLHNSEIKLSGKCGKRLEKKNKGCKADHAFGFIPAC